MYDDYTCRLYIESDRSLEEITNTIKNFTDGSKSNKTILTDMFEIDVEESLDADKEYIDKEDGFLFYRFNVYVEPNSDDEYKKYIKSLSKLISDLRTNGARVVASCEFEQDISSLTGWNWSERTPKHP